MNRDTELTLEDIRKLLLDITEKVEMLKTVSSQQSQPLFSKCLNTLKELEGQDDFHFKPVFDSLKDNPFIEDFPPMLDRVIESLEKIRISGLDPLSSGPATRQSTPTDCSAPDCNNYPDQIAADAAHIAVATLEIGVAIAEAAKDLIPETTLGFTNPAWIVAAALANGLNIDAKIAAEVEAALQLEADKNDKCEEDGYQTMLRGICSTVNTINDTVNEINRKVDYLIVLAEDIKKTVHQIADRQIEQILASCGRLTSLYLPVAFGGHLEDVQRIVQTLIEQSKAAGLDTCNAQSYYNQGSAAFLRGEYKKAYQWFVDAYQQLLCC